MRLLSSDQHPSDTPVDEDILASLYAVPAGGGVRTNFVASLDGAATGSDGTSGTINNAADKIVYDLNRRLSDVVLVGERTADIEGYRPSADGPLLVAVSNRCHVPRGWTDKTNGRAIIATCGAAPAEAIAQAREALGEDSVLVVGQDAVDLRALLAQLADQGLRNVLCEGGPTLHAEMLDLGLVTELALTWVPTAAGGDGPRITHGKNLNINFTLRHLLEQDGTLLGLWAVAKGA